MPVAYECGHCTKRATWVRSTQFSGDHYFCTEHAKKEEDFGKSDPSYFFWKKVKRVRAKAGDPVTQKKKVYLTSLDVALGRKPHPMG